MKPLRVAQLPWRPATHAHTFRHSSRPLREAQWTARRYNQHSRNFQTISESESRISEVKLHRKFFTWRRFGLFVLYTAGPYLLLSYAIDRLLEGEDLEEDEEEEAVVEAEDGDDEDEVENGLEKGTRAGAADVHKNSVQLGDKDSVFIPLQYPKKLPQNFYKNSDPEWQEFVNVSRNKKRQKALREELAAAVAKDLAKFPKIKMALGNDIKLTKAWLELKYPDGPPPDYARKGLQITDEYIAWSTQIIPHSHYIHLHHILWPQAVFKAAWYTVRIFYGIQSLRLKTALGLNLNEQDRGIKSILVTEKSLRELLKQQEKVNEDTASSKNPKNTKQAGAKSTQWVHPPISTRPNTSATTFTSGNSIGQGSGPTTTLNIDDTGHKTPLDLAISMKTFITVLRKHWSATKQDKLPRGCFAVLGHVEVMGTRGRAKCEVFGAYDPKLNKYVYVTATLQHYWELQQRAKGGP